MTARTKSCQRLRSGVFSRSSGTATPAIATAATNAWASAAFSGKVALDRVASRWSAPRICRASRLASPRLSSENSGRVSTAPSWNRRAKAAACFWENRSGTSSASVRPWASPTRVESISSASSAMAWTSTSSLSKYP